MCNKLSSDNCYWLLNQKTASLEFTLEPGFTDGGVTTCNGAVSNDFIGC